MSLDLQKKGLLQYSVSLGAGRRPSIRISVAQELLAEAGISPDARVQLYLDHRLRTGTLRATAQGTWRMTPRGKRSWFAFGMDKGWSHGTRLYLDLVAIEHGTIVFQLPAKEEDA